MIFQSLYLIIGLFLLIVGSNYLLKSSVDLSLKYGISKVVIGLTVVSFATSAPELLISISSALKESISISNVIGSNIANIGLVFSTALFFVTIKITKNNIKYDLPWLIVVSFIFLFFLQDLKISKSEGFIFIFLLSAFIYFMLKIRVSDENQNDVKISEMSITKIIFLIIISSLMLFFGSELFVNSAIYFANYFQVSERIIGLTLVAIGTSLPELVTTLVAIYKKELDISVGNIIGSNIFNILAVIGITSAIIELNLEGQQIISFDIYVMIGFSILLAVFFFIPKKYTLFRLHGIIFFILFLTYYYMLL